MREAPPADIKLFPIDGNDTYGDCVVAATAHLFYNIFGAVIPLPSVLKEFAGWCSSNGCYVGWFMWMLWWNGMNGKRIRSFGTIAPTQKDVQWAIDNYGGCTLNVFNGDHQVAVIGNVGDEEHFRVVVWGQNGFIQNMTWADITGTANGQLALNTKGHFVMSPKFDLLLPLLGIKNNWVWWIVLPVIAGLGVYAAKLLGYL